MHCGYEIKWAIFQQQQKQEIMSQIAFMLVEIHSWRMNKCTPAN